MNIYWLILIVAALLLVVVLFLSRSTTVSAWFKTQVFSFGIATGQPKRQASIKDHNLVIGPDEGKYEFSTGVLRHIPDPETLEACGFDRKHFVRWDKKRFDKSPKGHALQSVKTARLVAKLNTSGVYAVIEGQKRWVPDPETLGAMGRNFEEVNWLLPDAFDNIPQGIKLVEFAKWSTHR